MWRPTPYADRDRLDRIYRATRQDPRGSISPADYLDLIHGSPRPQPDQKLATKHGLGT
jgi:hypothetical protein